MLNSRFAVIFRIGISVALIAYLLSLISSSTIETVSRLNGRAVLAAALLMASTQVSAGIRLATLLSSTPITVGQAIRATFAGYFYSNFLPGTASGDIVRMVRLRSAGVELAQAVGGLLLDRLLHTALILALALPAAAPLMRAFLADWHPSNGAVLVFAFLTVAGAAFGARMLRDRVRPLLKEAAQPFVALMKSPSRMAIAGGMTICSVGASILAQWILVRELALPFGLLEFIGLVCLVTLFGLLPVSLNGLGIQEAGYVVGMHHLGGAEPSAVAFAVMVRVLILATSLIGGVITLAEGISSLKSSDR